MIASPCARRAASLFVASQHAAELDRKEMRATDETSVSNAFRMPIAADASPQSPCCVSASNDEPEAPAAREMEMETEPASAYDAEQARLEAVEKMRLWHEERDATLPERSARLAVVARAVTNLNGKDGAWVILDETDEGWDATPTPAVAEPMKLAEQAVVAASQGEAPSGAAAQKSSDGVRINSCNDARLALVDIDVDPLPSALNTTHPIKPNAVHAAAGLRWAKVQKSPKAARGCWTPLGESPKEPKGHDQDRDGHAAAGLRWAKAQRSPKAARRAMNRGRGADENKRPPPPAEYSDSTSRRWEAVLRRLSSAGVATRHDRPGGGGRRRSGVCVRTPPYVDQTH